MLSYQEFVDAVRESIPRFQQYWLNDAQDQAVAAPPHPPTLIVAGPGAGKTTVLALRVLKLILVDQLTPESIMATTFTRKAAAELRSRILSWGYAGLQYAANVAQQANNQARLQWLDDIDINRVVIGTLDALASQFLADCRQPGEITPATAEAFLSRGLLRRRAVFVNGRYRDQDLAAHLNNVTPHFPRANSLADKLTVISAFCDRVRHDQIDLNQYGQQGTGQQVLVDTVQDYLGHLTTSHLADFARFEEMLLQGLEAATLAPLTNRIQAVLVDEFQDTNYLQERIYLELCSRATASLTVVGDDDQSIYRFRGATVEIFANFSRRIVEHSGDEWRPRRIDLVDNYRSKERIVEFCNRFVQADPRYQTARVSGKQPIHAAAVNARDPATNLPVLGLFRADLQTLASDLTRFLIEVFNGGGHTVQCGDGQSFDIVAGPGGSFGDAVLLANRVREQRAGNNPDRLPLLLRQGLTAQGVPVFNPRGRSLGDIPSVQRLLGTALLCIDPNATVLRGIGTMAQQTRARLMQWRQVASQFVNSNPTPGGLPAFVRGWEQRTPGPGSQMKQWPDEWPLLELIFTLTTWLPPLQTEPEGQVYLEAVARTIAEVGQMAPYSGRILNTGGQHDDRSVQVAIREVFEAIGGDDIAVDEEIMPHVPRNYFPLMTIHQAKGLEFPLVIVDVGSDFRTNHHTQKRFRFPDKGDNVHVLEDDVAVFCPVGQLRTQRAMIDRAWDDLRRLYFVGYSRAQNVLLLAGLTSQLRQQNPVPSIATGDLQDSPRFMTLVPAADWTPNCSAETVALI